MTDLVRAGKVRAIGSSTMPASMIVEAQWVAERRGLQRFRTEQPPYSILNRGIEREVLPVAQRYGMGTLVWGPFGQGLLTGRVRKGAAERPTRAQFFRHLNDERRLDVVEQLVPLAEEAGLPMTHLAMAFAIAHPGVTTALLGPRTMEHLDDLLAGADVALTDEVLDRIDEIVPPGTDVGAPRPGVHAPGAAGPAPAPPPGQRALRDLSAAHPLDGGVRMIRVVVIDHHPVGCAGVNAILHAHAGVSAQWPRPAARTSRSGVGRAPRAARRSGRPRRTHRCGWRGRPRAGTTRSRRARRTSASCRATGRRRR